MFAADRSELLNLAPSSRVAVALTSAARVYLQRPLALDRIRLAAFAQLQLRKDELVQS